MAHKVIRYNIDVAISVESCINELEKGNLLRCYRLVFAGRGLNKEAIASEKASLTRQEISTRYLLKTVDTNGQ